MIHPTDTSDTCAVCLWCGAAIGQLCRSRKSGRVVAMHRYRAVLVNAARTVKRKKEERKAA